METFNVAICEDRREDVALLRDMLISVGISVDIFTFESGEAFLNAFRPGFFQLVLLDIYLDGPPEGPRTASATGVDVALAVREADADVWLVFTTLSPDQAVFGYQVKADRYLLKPLDPQEVASLMHRMKQHWQAASDTVTVTVERRRRDIRPRDVLYVEAHGKRSVIHMQNETLCVYATMEQLERLLSSPTFLRCHRGYLVNMDYIQSADRDFNMVNGDKVYIGRNNQWKMREAYRSYIVRLARGNRG